MSAAEEVRIVGFDPRWREEFATLNIEWLQRWFEVEPHDHEVLGNPEHHILAEGGHILFAVGAGGHALGTVALKHDGAGVYELTKMAVTPAARGQGLGRLLIDAALALYQTLEGRELYWNPVASWPPRLRCTNAAGFATIPRRARARTMRAPTCT